MSEHRAARHLLNDMNGGLTMNWNMIEGNWRQYRFELLRNWQCLTEENLASITGKRAQFGRLLQEVYDISAEEAERQIDAFQGVVTATPVRGVREKVSEQAADLELHGTRKGFLQWGLRHANSKSG